MFSDFVNSRGVNLEMTFKVNLDGETGKTVSLTLMRNVANASEVVRKVIDGSLDCCIIKPSLILDAFHVVAAANKAVVALKQEKMTTKKLNTEVLYNLSITKNISQSLAKYGVSVSDTVMLVCVVESVGENKLDSVISQIRGERCGIDVLQRYCDKETIKKNYKIKDSELQVSSLLDSVISRIASKDVVL